MKKIKIITSILLICMIFPCVIYATEIPFYFRPSSQSRWMLYPEHNNFHMGSKNTTFTYSDATAEAYEPHVDSGISMWGSYINMTRNDEEYMGTIATVHNEQYDAVAWVDLFGYSLSPPYHRTSWTLTINIPEFDDSEMEAEHKKRAIAHEIGHVYGLADLYEGYETQIMYGYANSNSEVTTYDKWGMEICTDVHSSHSYESNFSYEDEYMHIKRCTYCKGYNEGQSHSFSTNYNSIQHWSECTSCQYEKNHNNHNMYDWISNGPAGEIKTCNSHCGYYETRDHDLIEYWVFGWEPTCENPGMKGYDCRTCTYNYEEAVPALGHDWQPATCTLPSTCSRCDATIGNPLEHDWEWVTLYDYMDASTCPYRRYWEDEMCTVCGEWHWVERSYDIYEGHEWVWWVYYAHKDESTCPYRRYWEDEKCIVCQEWHNVDRTYDEYEGHEWEWVTYSDYKDESTCPYRRYWEDELCIVCWEWHWVDRSYDVYEDHDWLGWVFLYGDWDYYTGEWVDYYYNVCDTCGEMDYKEERY